MEIDVSVVADAANVSQEGKLNILGVFDTIWAREFPFRHGTMVFVMRATAPYPEQGEHRMEVRLIDADGAQLFKAEGPLRVAIGRPGRPSKPHVIMGLSGITFPKPGDYSFEVILDGRHRRSVALHVVEAPPGSDRPPEGERA